MHQHVLIVTNRYDITTDFVVLRLREMGEPFLRLNTDVFPDEVTLALKHSQEHSDATVDYGGVHLSLSDIRSVWFRRPKHSDAVSDLPAWQAEMARDEAREVLWGLYHLLESAFWVSDPLAIRRAEHKLLQLQLAPRFGFTIPKTLATNSPDEAREFISALKGEVVIKLLGRGHTVADDAVHVMYTSRVTAEDTDRLNDLNVCPCLFQEFVRKRADLRVTVVGQDVFAVRIESQLRSSTSVDWRADPDAQLPSALVQLPSPLENACRDMVRHLGLQFGAIDLAIGESDQVYFLEINPNGQWAWLEETGAPLCQAITDLLLGRGKPL